MLSSFVHWLDQLGSQVFWTCAVLLVTVDVVAAAVVMRTRSRELVNRWTGRVLAVNALLLGAGAGVPAVTYATKIAVVALAPSLRDAAMRSRASEPAPVREK